MTSGIGLYLKVCLDYYKHHRQNQINVKFGILFSEYWKTMKSYFIYSSVFTTSLNFSLFNKSKETNPRRFIIGGNWKMNGDREDIEKIIGNLKKVKLPKNMDIVVAVPSIYLELAKKYEPKHVNIAAQNCYKSEDITGEITPTMLHDLGIDWVILGDYSRRFVFGESDELIGQKVEDALCEGIRVIVCVVDCKEDHKCGKSEEVIFRQLQAIEDAVNDWCEVIVAYEPVWTFEEHVTPQQVQTMHCRIREWIQENNSEQLAKKIRIIYAGNVTCDNAKELSEQRDIDGLLLGEASLYLGFIGIMNILKSKKKTPCVSADHGEENEKVQQK